MKRAYIILLILFAALHSEAVAQSVRLSGRVTARGEGAVPFAAVFLQEASTGVAADSDGAYSIDVPAGNHTLVVTAVGYEPFKKQMTLRAGTPANCDVQLQPAVTMLDDVVVEASLSGVSRVRRSAFNVIALDTEKLLNTTKSLGDALAKTPGMKLRESGGVGSEMSLMLDGFSGKHIKIFIDGVPQEGVGGSFGLNNIPVNFAERIEVYRGVVPVEFGTDALGGIVNIVTNKRQKGWHLDASYSYGSFNTHKSFVNFSHRLGNGFTYEVNAFQNYSDNNYSVNAPIEDFATGRIDKKTLYNVERFNDTYHNEAVAAKVGLVGKRWADRLMLGVTYSQMYKDVQTGVRQEIVYGEKHRKSNSVMPSLEYKKQNIFTRGLSVSFTANYNRTETTNVDTAGYKYNWYGERKKLNSPGEQSRQYSRADNDNWNATFNAEYRIGRLHTLTLHHVYNAFERSNTSLLAVEAVEDAIAKETTKNITGLSYRLVPSDRWNVTVFGKYYHLRVSGPVAVTSNGDEYSREARSLHSYGYGVAGTCFILPGLQAKISYEKACRLPTVEEIFGDEDLEIGTIGINPEISHNVNLNLSYNRMLGNHSLYAEGGLIYRDTRDYIQRNVIDISGGKSAATYVNYGKVLTKGYNISLRYSFGRNLSVGGNFTHMEVLDNMKNAMGSTAANLGYKERMPNLPYLFADFDATFHWHDLFGQGNRLTVTYDNMWVEEFSYYSSLLGTNKGDYMVPSQFSHNLTLTYSMAGGRYNFSLECKNFTDEALYDNFSLQKAGRAFYGKVRICLKNNK